MTVKRVIYGTDWDMDAFQGASLQSISTISTETRTAIWFDKAAGTLEIEGDSEESVHQAHAEITKLLREDVAQQPRRGEWAKPDRPGLWGQRRDLKRKAPEKDDEDENEQDEEKSGTSHDHFDGDAEPPTLPAPWLMVAAASPEIDIFRPRISAAQSTVPEEPHRVVEKVLPRRDRSSQKEFVLPLELGMRRKVFQLHAYEACLRTSHQKKFEINWCCKPHIIDKLTPCEERDLIVKLKEIAEKTGACFAYKKRLYGIHLTSDNQEEIDFAKEWLMALEHYLDSFVVNLPIPLSQLGSNPPDRARRMTKDKGYDSNGANGSIEN
ncbi:uncharacterized protein SPPG_07314 [Spizellomyces punctatus DAOM BR117]|uniref:Uncharacterized protein n=1 Tax=Spizellomyces punctatus (strain DAOM BR117) TaxID=645134 RepID=A0A0L0H8R3_SPIPD|nr:uncharacterized protein SPPG_07314 [Spizellomyces punctatus DAOM BR117]KNC97386.1 hypothetical protein SPPG_07314 [Spizellomyces punctatus DAOM BR117]|eukprot:XP_016605426.1 hypothetical protein SPPG_07314 [Spizellomyces punctatus DAOM BR117]